MIGKYSIVAFNDKLIHSGSFYVIDIRDGLIELAMFPRMVDEREIHELSFDDLKTSDLVSTHAQLKFLEELYRKEIRRRAYDIEKNKRESKYWHDDFTVK